MVTEDNSTQIIGGELRKNATYYGLSTDNKPTDCGNGSVFIAMDTGKAYFFNAAGLTWIEA